MGWTWILHFGARAKGERERRNESGDLARGGMKAEDLMPEPGRSRSLARGGGNKVP